MALFSCIDHSINAHIKLNTSFTSLFKIIFPTIFTLIIFTFLFSYQKEHPDQKFDGYEEGDDQWVSLNGLVINKKTNIVHKHTANV